MKQRRRGCEWERVATAFILSWAQQWRDNAIKSYIIGNTCAHPHTHTHFRRCFKREQSQVNVWVFGQFMNRFFRKLYIHSLARHLTDIYIYIEKIFIQSNPRQLSSTKRYTHKSLALWLIIKLFVLLFCAFFFCVLIITFSWWHLAYCSWLYIWITARPRPITHTTYMRALLHLRRRWGFVGGEGD